VSGLLRLAWSASLGPGNDESYYYLFTVHRDWSYFDQPPMLAVVERLGIALAGGTVSAFSLRLGFILLFAGSTWLMARVTSRLYGPRAGFLAALALNVTAYHGSAAATFALPDGPLLFFWLLTLDRLAVALDAPGTSRPWLGVGLAWGGALLSKYHAVFLPAATLLYLAIEPSARPWLRRAGPYIAVACGLALFSPVLWWNATHSWASFAFQGGGPSAGSPSGPRPCWRRSADRPSTCSPGSGCRFWACCSGSSGACAPRRRAPPTASCSARRWCRSRSSSRWPARGRSCRTDPGGVSLGLPHARPGVGSAALVADGAPAAVALGAAAGHRRAGGGADPDRRAPEGGTRGRSGS